MVCLAAFLGSLLALAAPTGETCSATARCAETCPREGIEACVNRCAARAEPTVARPLFDALQKCSKPACAPRCVDASSLTCRMCVLASCSTEVGNCMSH